MRSLSNNNDDATVPSLLRDQQSSHFKDPSKADLMTPKTTALSKVLDAQGRLALPIVRWQTLALVIIFSLALGLRLVHINSVGYNSDEAVYAGQAAALANAPVLKDIFPVFRAHPLLFQFILALSFSFGVYDWLGRLIVVLVGLATILLVYKIGKRLYGRNAGLVAALFLAVMPYHVIPTRQVLLDGPMTLCATLTLYLLIRFSETEQPLWLYAAGAGMGLTFLSKETGILMVGAIYAYLALSPRLWVRISEVIVSFVVMVMIMAPHPLSVMLAGGGGGGKTKQYLVWQLFRRPNHTWDFYPTVVPPAIGILVIAAAIIGLWVLRRNNSWRERLLVLWILVPTAFFQLWPTKGFQYLLPIAVPMVLLAARTLTHWPSGVWPNKFFHLGHFRVRPAQISLLVTSIIALTLIVSSWTRITPSTTGTFLAGSGGVPGGRELGEWLDNNVPKGATFMTIGPSMANIIKFYSHRQAYGLSVSPNPLHRNPSYEPVYNPDYQIRTGDLQYLVWDSFSAERSSFFSEKLLAYAQKYHGRAVHTETVMVTTPEGEQVAKPVIIVYEVHP